MTHFINMVNKNQIIEKIDLLKNSNYYKLINEQIQFKNNFWILEARISEHLIL